MRLFLIRSPNRLRSSPSGHVLQAAKSKTATIFSLSETGNLAEAARKFYGTLREADASPNPLIVSAYFCPATAWPDAINDRLRRAAVKRNPTSSHKFQALPILCYFCPMKKTIWILGAVSDVLVLAGSLGPLIGTDGTAGGSQANSLAYLMMLLAAIGSIVAMVIVARKNREGQIWATHQNRHPDRFSHHGRVFHRQRYFLPMGDALRLFGKPERCLHPRKKP